MLWAFYAEVWRELREMLVAVTDHAAERYRQRVLGSLRQPHWQFRAPRALDELVGFVEHEMRAIGTMYQSSEYSAPYIGGEVQMTVIEVSFVMVEPVVSGPVPPQAAAISSLRPG
jgi:hypothetical protein